MIIELPFPPASLSGHANGRHWAGKSAVTKEHRRWAWSATKEAKIKKQPPGDIRIHVRFEPPNRRGDRTNFANRMKPYFDGIAEAMGVNDARFLPSYEYGDPIEHGRVLITIGDEI